MIISTFNVNSIKARLPNVLNWLKSSKPDVVCLQEIKCIDENFPAIEFEDLGYNVAVHGQKTYNGVAILSKYPLEDIRCGLDGVDWPDSELENQARYIEAFTNGVRVASIYLPNGNPVLDADKQDSEKYKYKLRWMDRLNSHAADLLKFEEKLVLAGDYNIIPKDEDCYDPAAWEGDAATLPESRKRYRTLLNMGLTDALRATIPQGNNFTFWDYQRGSWQKDHGIRIDHLLLSPQAADCLTDCQIERDVRGQQKASDHTPIWIELDLE
jgi:exodeoxyribonuclease-3